MFKIIQAVIIIAVVTLLAAVVFKGLKDIPDDKANHPQEIQAIDSIATKANTAAMAAADSTGVTIRHHRPRQDVVYHNITVGGFMPSGQVYFHRDGNLMVISGSYTIEYNDTVPNP